MSDLNALYLQGRLTKDASLNTLSNGSAVATLSLAVNKDYLDSSTNEWKKITNFFDISYWGESAKKNLSEYTKGREVLVEAELKTSSWENNHEMKYCDGINTVFHCNKVFSYLRLSYIFL